MIGKLKTTTSHLIGRITYTARAVAAEVAGRLQDLWHEHRERLEADRDYAPAVAAALSAVAALFTADPAVLAVVAAAVGLYLAIHHATRPQSTFGSTGRQNGTHASWEPPRDRWDDRMPRWDDPSAGWDDNRY